MFSTSFFKTLTDEEFFKTLMDKKIVNIDQFIRYLESANIPHRVFPGKPTLYPQRGPTCGSVALQRITSAWNSLDSAYSTEPARKEDINAKNTAIMSYRKRSKKFNNYVDGVFDFEIIKNIAQEVNYKADILEFQNLEEFLAIIKNDSDSQIQIPIILPIDSRDPSEITQPMSTFAYQGKHAHHITLFGYFDVSGRTYCIINTYTSFYVVDAEKLYLSCSNLQTYPGNEWKKPSNGEQRIIPSVDLEKLKNHLVRVYPESYQREKTYSSNKKESLLPIEEQIELAAQFNHLSVIQQLLNSNETSVKKNELTVLALKHAIHSKSWDVIEEIVLHRMNDNIEVKKFLIENQNLLSIAIERGKTDIVDALVKIPEIDVNYGTLNQPPLTLAINKGYTEVVKALLTRSNIRVNKGMFTDYPLDLAIEKGHTEIVKALLDHRNILVNKENEDGKSPLYSAIEKGHTEIVNALLTHSKIKFNEANSFDRLLNLAIEKGHTEIVNALLIHSKSDLLTHSKIKVDKANDFYFSLHLALENSYRKTLPLPLAVEKGHTEIVKALLTHCPDIWVNKQNEDGKSPLYIAIEKGNTEIVKALLTHLKIEVNKANCLDLLSPDLSISLKNGHTKIVKNFIQSNFKVNEANIFDLPLHLAVENGNTEIVKALLAHPDIKVNKKNYSNGKSPLYIAIEKGHTEIVKALLAHSNINVNKTLNIAIQNNETNVVNALLDQLDIKIETSKIKIDDTETLLRIAVENNKVDAVTKLITKLITNQKLTVSAAIEKNYFVTAAELIKKELETYLNSVKNRKDGHHKETFSPFGQTLINFGYSAKDKRIAAETLRDVMLEIEAKILRNVMLEKKDLDVLKGNEKILINGELGKIYRKYLLLEEALLKSNKITLRSSKS